MLGLLSPPITVNESWQPVIYNTGFSILSIEYGLDSEFLEKIQCSHACKSGLLATG
jgi:hypothetical protein